MSSDPYVSDRTDSMLLQRISIPLSLLSPLIDNHVYLAWHGKIDGRTLIFHASCVQWLVSVYLGDSLCFGCNWSAVRRDGWNMSLSGWFRLYSKLLRIHLQSTDKK
jgi:hypothetical protein